MIKNRLGNTALMASLAVNLMVIGALAGDWVRQSWRPPPPMHWATDGMDEGARARVREILEQYRPMAESLRHDLRAIDQDINAVIRVADLSSDDLNRVLTQRRLKREEYQRLLQTSLESLLPTLTPREREAILQRILIGSASMPPRRGGRRPGHPEGPMKHPPPAFRDQ